MECGREHPMHYDRSRSDRTEIDSLNGDYEGAVHRLITVMEARDNLQTELDGLKHTIALMEDAIDKAGMKLADHPDNMEHTRWVLVEK